MVYTDIPRDQLAQLGEEGIGRPVLEVRTGDDDPPGIACYQRGTGGIPGRELEGAGETLGEDGGGLRDLVATGEELLRSAEREEELALLVVLLAEVEDLGVLDDAPRVLLAILVASTLFFAGRP